MGIDDGLRARATRALSIANLIANIGIVVTGSAVRVTGSGLGCPTWPRCTESSYVPHGELGIHGAIEFGNRMLTFVVGLVALACLIAAYAWWRESRRVRPLKLSLAVMLGIPAQAILGGFTVLTDLNPWVVALHLLVSLFIIGVCAALIDATKDGERSAAPRQVQRLTGLVYATAWVVFYLGTIVTGSGPHSGDEDSRRTGLDPQVMSHLHAASVYLLVALTIGLVVLARRKVTDTETGRRGVVFWAATLLVVELAQGLIGFVQYFTDLPAALVISHLLGAAILSATAAAVLVTSRARVLT